MNNDIDYNTETPWSEEQMKAACEKRGSMKWQGPKEKVNWNCLIMAVLIAGIGVYTALHFSPVYYVGIPVTGALAWLFYWLMGLAIKGVR